MARNQDQQGLLPSILDRLCDPDSTGTAWRRGYSIAQMMDSVQRDLEDLLNTRQSRQGLGEQFPELENSIVGYGLPDLTSLDAISPEQREQIGRLLEATISRFEPRLRDVRASLLNPGDGKERSLRFRVEARVCVEPAPPVAFETVLELTTGHYTVKPSEV
jgi:type VI secretion system protein ImpF